MIASAPAWTGTTVCIRGVNHYFGKNENRKQVLFNNDLDLRRGEIVIMTGPSGSGKTTLLTLVGGLRSLQEGSLKVMGCEMAGLDPAALVQVRRHIGFIFQAHNLFDSLTARQNVRIALELHNGRHLDRRAIEMLSRLGLGKRVQYKPQALSGGQRQRVAIARALVNRPKLVLADEPTAALDKESGGEVIKLFQQLAREDGTTILLVTHDARILDAADRIVNMVDGHVVSNVEVEASLAMSESMMHVPALANQHPAILAGIVQRAGRRMIRRGKTIIAQGDPPREFFIIRAGEVNVVCRSAAGESLLRTLGPGDFFGEAALLKGEPHAASYVAADDVDLYTLSAEAFDEAVRSSPTFKQQLADAFFQARF